MGLKQWLFSNMLTRNMLTDLWERPSKKQTKFVPYFQYIIGKYDSDEYLYFPKEPYAEQYKNEVFNKLLEYTGYDLINYLEFHYTRYPNKQDFLRFLEYELSERLTSRRISQERQRKNQSAFNWVLERKREIQKAQEKQIKAEITQGVQTIIQNGPTSTPQELDTLIQNLTNKLSNHLETITAETEKGVQNLTGIITRGNIQLNNRVHEDKLVQLLILLQEVMAPPQQSKTEQLFKKFPASDIAAILHLHFEAFNDKKLTTIQRKVTEQTERIRPNQAQIKKLTAALQEFFYQ
jgi:hypothetical protein